MNQLTLKLPKTLQHQLEALARSEGVTLSQYILFALTRQVKQGYLVDAVVEKDIARQQTAFADLLGSLGKATSSEIEQTLAGREPVKPEKGLSSQTVKRLRGRMNRESPRT
jgi:hypothetical protein